MILIHGAGLGPWIWDATLPHLSEPAEAVTRSVQSTLEQCIDEVAARAEDRIVVGHSFGAMIALGAAAKTHVRAVVMIGGMVPKSGESFLSLIPFPQRAIFRLMLQRATNGIELPKTLARKEYCNDLDEAAAQQVMDRLVPEAPRLYLDPLRWGAEPSRRFYIKLHHDKSFSPRKQDRMIMRTRAHQMDLPTGHLPMLAAPAQLAAMLNVIIATTR